MAQLLLVYAVLLLIAIFGGYAPAQWLARGIPSGERFAAMPLLGVSCTALSLLWVNLFVPLHGWPVLVGLVPAIFGLVTALRDLYHRRLRVPRLSMLMWLGTFTAGSACVLAPFILLRSATSFGITNNDAFWYTQADWRVQVTSYLARPEQMHSTLARYPGLIQRYGLDYLSVLIQSITGLRSWQTVHLVGAFGVLLVILSGAMLARRARVWWPLTILAGVAGAANHFVYRLYLDAFLAFGYGLAFLIGICWLLASPAVTGKSNRHITLLALLLAGSVVCYMDIIPIIAVICVSFIVFAQKLDFDRLGMFGLAALLAAVLSGPMVLVMPLHLQAVANAPGIGVFITFPDRVADACYLLGTVSLQDMLEGVRPSSLAILGAVAVGLLLASAGWRIRRQGLRSCVVLLYLGPLGLLFAYLLWVKHTEYSAHRVYAMMAAVAPILILGNFGRKQSEVPRILKVSFAVLLALATAACIHAQLRLLAAVVRSDIHVTKYEKEIGDLWIPSLPGGSRILIDAGDDDRLLAPHYMYWETLYGARYNEGRIIFPHHKYAYITPAPEIGDIDLSRCDYVLRRRNRHRFYGDMQTIRSNTRYELLIAPIIYYFDKGFYGPEQDTSGVSRWMNQDGHLVIVSHDPCMAEFNATISANPTIQNERISFRLNAAPIDGELPSDGRNVSVVLRLKSGSNTLTIHSAIPPSKPNTADQREISTHFANVSIHRLDTLAKPDGSKDLSAPER